MWVRLVLLVPIVLAMLVSGGLGLIVADKDGLVFFFIGMGIFIIIRACIDHTASYYLTDTGSIRTMG